MADYCVLRLSTGERVDWLVVDGLGHALAPVAGGTLADAALAAAGRRLVVLVPGGDVALAEPEVPLRAGRLLAAVPYALEESLAGDVEQMHFAIGRPRGNRVPTAAVERARMQSWVDTLAGAGLLPEALYSEAMVMPDNPGHTVVILDGPRLLVRHPEHAGLVIEADPLEASLRLVGLPPAAAAQAQTHVLLYASDADWTAHQAVFERLKAHVATLNVQILPDGALPLLAAGAVSGAPFSLLQGSFATRGDWGGQWSRWRLAAGLFGLFLVLNAATQGYSYLHLKSEEKKLDSQILAVARDAMPDLTNPTRMPNLRAVAEGRVRSLGSSGHNGLLGALGAVAQAMGQAPDTKLSTVSYHEGTTDLTVDAPDVGAIDRFQQAITSQGLQAALQGTTQHEARYQGHVQVKGAG